tara:strand:+ start:256 stop:495 length:240 start_codon:yes stop_codon:yes gene_type:complete
MVLVKTKVLVALVAQPVAVEVVLVLEVVVLEHLVKEVMVEPVLQIALQTLATLEVEEEVLLKQVLQFKVEKVAMAYQAP